MLNQQEQDQEPLAVPTIHPYITQMDQFKHTIEEEIEKLKQRKPIIEEPPSSKDLLVKRYQSEKSVIGGVALWYGGFALWKKILFGILIGAISVGLGFLCHAPIAIAVVGVSCYVIFTLLCIDHYNVTEKQMKLLSEDIIELEKSVGETIKIFNTFSEKLHLIYVKAYELSSHFGADVEQMENKIDALNLQLAEYQKIWEQLSQSEKHITASASELIQTLDQCSSELSKSCAAFQHESVEFAMLNEHLMKINHILKKSAETLCDTQLHESYMIEFKRIKETAEKMQTLFNMIKSSPYLLQITSQSTSSAVDPHNAAKISLEETAQLIEQSHKALEIFDLYTEIDTAIENDVAQAEARSDILLGRTHKPLLVSLRPPST